MKTKKEEVNIYEMYGKDSMLSKDEFIKKYNITESRTFYRKGRRKFAKKWF